jgi:hypothetical protein
MKKVLSLWLMPLLIPLGVYGVQQCHYRMVTRPLSISEAISNRKCEVHGVVLQKDVVPLDYGLIGFDFKEAKARRSLFPHSRFNLNGGCVVDRYTRAEVLYCDQCRKAERGWKSK